MCVCVRARACVRFSLSVAPPLMKTPRIKTVGCAKPSEH